MSSDTLSEVLRAVRLTGAVFFSVDAAAPWVAEAPAACELGPFIMPGVEHVIEYHVVTAGSCWGGIVNEPAVHLQAGDVICFPQGDSHVLASEPGKRAPPEIEMVRRAREGRLPVKIRTGVGDGPHTELVCGFLGCDARPFNPLLVTLPRVLVVRRPPEGGGVIEQLVKLAVVESQTPSAGGDCVLARLSELLFVEVVRRYVSTMPPDQVGWLAGLRNESVGRVLGILHANPAHDHNLDDLAREVGLARSVLAERFAHYVGIPPMHYLAQWRMQLASGLLSSTTLSLSQVAERVGYGSEAALSRAFKRCVGLAPAEWRRARRSVGEPSLARS